MQSYLFDDGPVPPAIEVEKGNNGVPFFEVATGIVHFWRRVFEVEVERAQHEVEGVLVWEVG